VLVKGPIVLGDVTRGLAGGRTLKKDLEKLNQNQLLTFVSLTGDKITLTGTRYYGVQIISLRPGLGRPVQQLGFDKGSGVAFMGGICLSTPVLESLTRQLSTSPMIDYLATFGATSASYSVHIDEQVRDYEFSVQ
ncbi:MAG TPA: hypothetical protein PKO06_13765, partial [Candidatus Ozemobacteraceae bacterium]|nr:hypothetical protein [Candidatus Ozemobacteraceae bacterium]